MFAHLNNKNINNLSIFKQESYTENNGKYEMRLSLNDYNKIEYNEIKKILEEIFNNNENLKDKKYEFKFNFGILIISIETNSFTIVSAVKNELEYKLKKILDNKDIFL
ncbi:MAG: hypothetical protein ACP5RI_00940 [Candidatus Micrarchaeia archaeon]